MQPMGPIRSDAAAGCKRVSLDRHPMYSLVPGLGRGSAYEQAQTELRGVESDEVAVAFGPPAGDKVVAEAVYRALLGLRPDSGPHGYSATNIIVQVCLGPAPVGLEEAVGAVPRMDTGSIVKTTTRRATRRISRRPAIGSDQ